MAFDPATDYDTYVDGESRADGTASFLASRGIELPVGGPEYLSGAETITALGAAKNEILLRRIRHDGVQAYAGSVRYVRAVRMVGLHTAVVSSSANCAQILAAAGIAELFDIRNDGLSLCAPTGWRANPNRTAIWPLPGRWVWRPGRVRCSRTPSPVCRPGEPAGSGT